jgi:hypothetical protein
MTCPAIDSPGSGGFVSTIRRSALIVLAFAMLSSSVILADETPRRSPRDRSLVRQFLIWVMDELSGPPPH